MAKTAAISVRVEPDLKEALEEQAQREGRTLASYVERILAIHLSPPLWSLREVTPSHLNVRGPMVVVPVAEGWPVAVITAEHAINLANQLIRAAEIARDMPAAE